MQADLMKPEAEIFFSEVKSLNKNKIPKTTKSLRSL